MKFIKLRISSYGGYSYYDASCIEMNILGNFLSDAVSCYDVTFREWALADKNDALSKFTSYLGTDIILLEEDKGYVFLIDTLSERYPSDYIKMTVQQFVQLLDDWQEKVCKAKPKEVLIKHENGEFIIETNN